MQLERGSTALSGEAASPYRRTDLHIGQVIRMLLLSENTNE
jgi:hypothetical protein